MHNVAGDWERVLSWMAPHTIHTLCNHNAHTNINVFVVPQICILEQKNPSQTFRWSDSISAILGFDII